MLSFGAVDFSARDLIDLFFEDTYYAGQGGSVEEMLLYVLNLVKIRVLPTGVEPRTFPLLIRMLYH